MWGMGDAVILLPLLNQLKRYSKNAKIVVLATDETVKVFEGYADETVVFDSRLSIFLPFRILKTVLELRKKSIGIVFDFEQFTRISSILGFLSGGAERIGYCGTGKELLYTKCIKFNSDKHAIEAFGDILRSHTPTITIPKELLPLKISKEDEKIAKEFIAKNKLGKNIIGIHPGSGNTATFRRWEKEKFAKLADKLAEINYYIVITGTKEEKELLEWIRENTKCKPIIADSLTLKQFSALCRYFKLFISNDTGAMHVAAAMGAPTIGLFGPNTPKRYAPLGEKNSWIYKKLDCSPCIEIQKGIVPLECPAHKNAECMRKISVEEVFEKAKEMLS
jgi:heptosyltransferase-2